MTYIVTTKEQLKKAQKDKIQSFVVQGELAEQIQKSQKITTLSKVALVALGAGLAAAPFTGGASAAVGFTAVGLTAVGASAGVSTTVIFAVLALGGVTIVLALFKDYNVEYSIHPITGLSAKFTKK